ncbi:alpha/beta hydrolase [Nocardioides zeae]|uniref:alpha/beta hydrolase n=1 Tax=Nocardioides zeae TaxID=1457234 RepID=UPI00188544CA|nr:phospholipase [Nocardioides zeae]
MSILRVTTATTSWEDGEHDGRPTVVLAHGYGAHEGTLLGVARLLPDGVAWALLRAPLELAPGSHAWFPISTPGSPDPADVAPGVDAAHAWVTAHVPAPTTVLPVGFSQGGLVASQLLRTRPDRYAGAGLLGGFVLQGEVAGDAVLRRTRPPVFSGRGDADTVIAPHAVARTDTWLPEHTTATTASYPGLGHTISATEARDLARFVAGALL